MRTDGQSCSLIRQWLAKGWQRDGEGISVLLLTLWIGNLAIWQGLKNVPFNPFSRCWSPTEDPKDSTEVMFFRYHFLTINRLISLDVILFGCTVD